MTQDIHNPSHWTADEGKIFKRIADGLEYGEEIFLGYTYYINGQKLPQPKLEVIEDFEEVDKPKEDEPITE